MNKIADKQEVFHPPNNAHQEQPKVLLIDEESSEIVSTLLDLPYDVEHLTDYTKLGNQLNYTVRLPSLIMVNSHSNMVNVDRLLVRLKQSDISKTIPIILFCNCVDQCPDDKIRAFTLGCDDFITLPIDPREFVARIQSKVQSALCHQELAEMAFKDDLSGLINRRGYNHALINEWARCKRTKKTISMLIIDIDNFKEFNDKFGHAKGDELILLASETLKKAHNRSSDVVARYGGDEFILLLPDCAYDGASKIATDLIDAFNKLNITHNHFLKMSKFSISIGVSSLIPNNKNSASELFANADTALYQAKREGKNCWKRAD